MIEITIFQGRYNILNTSEVSWCFKIKSPHGTATIYAEEEPQLFDGFGVEDAVIEMRRLYSGYWVHSGRKEAEAVLDKIMDDLPRLELAYHEGQTQKFEDALERAQSRLDRHMKTLEFLREEVAT